MSVTEWGTAPSGEVVSHASIGTDQVRLGVLTWGATVQSLQVPGTDGWVELVLGFDTLTPYLGDQPYLGTTVGRFANRIAGASFELDGETFTLPANDGPNTLHGGPGGLGSRNWRLTSYDDHAVTLTIDSPDGEMGFPGHLSVETTFTVTDDTVHQVTRATTDRATVVNLTNHAYFNLHGIPRPIDDHVLRVPAGCYLPVDAAAIPLPGPPTCVAGTPFDLREAREIGPTAYDHTLVVDGEITLSAGGRTLTVTTTEPGVQLYTADHLDGSLADRHGRMLAPRSGVCLETQHFPDSPNRPDYPSTVLRPGDVFTTTTSWRITRD